MARKKTESELVKALNADPYPLGYQQCEWLSGTDRCRFPGSISSNTGPGGPYFCRHHFRCSDPQFGAQIVDASSDYRHPTEAEIAAAHSERARRSNEAKGLAQLPGESFDQWRKRTKKNTILKTMDEKAA